MKREHTWQGPTVLRELEELIQFEVANTLYDNKESVTTSLSLASSLAFEAYTIGETAVPTMTSPS